MVIAHLKTVIYACIINIIMCVPMHGITLVYNLRIAETTRTQLKHLVQKRHSIIAATPFAQFRQLLKDAHESAVGGLLTYIYMKEHFFARVNAAVGHVHAKSDTLNASFSRTQTDDILATVGYAFSVHEYLSMGASLHLGVPTHEDTSLQVVQLGTGHVGLGGQIDAAYSISDSQAFMAAARFIHFFPRNVRIMLNDVMQHFDFALGNAADLYFTYQKNWGRQHQLEVGYNPTFLFDAHTEPPLPELMAQINSTIHSFFGSYRYGFLIKNTYPSAIIIGTSIGVNPLPEQFGNTKIETVWFSWGINF